MSRTANPLNDSVFVSMTLQTRAEPRTHRSVEPAGEPEALERRRAGGVDRLVGEAEVVLGVRGARGAVDERRDLADPLAVEREHVERERDVRALRLEPRVRADRRLAVDPR